MTWTNKVLRLFKNNVGFIMFLIGLAFFRTAVADWNRVPSGSMEPTLYDGDWLVVNKIHYGPSLPFANKRLFDYGGPERGDVVTFVPPHTTQLYVKRVVGIPGDHISFAGREIFVNGEKLTSTKVPSDSNSDINLEYLDGASHFIQYGEEGNLPKINGAFTVPDDNYFVLGDHRNNSADSRYWGFVESDKIMGKVTHVAFSTSRDRFAERFALEIH